MQMYEGLPIATNKFSVAERCSIPHHLLDLIKLSDKPWTVSQFRNTAIQLIKDVRARGKLPVLVGGTHYYVQSLLFQDHLVGSGQGHMDADEQEKRWPVLGSNTDELLEELKKVDPTMAARWHPKDRRKIRRSLEIYLTTGRKASEIYEAQQRGRQAPLDAALNAETAPNTIDTDEDRDKALHHELLIFCTFVSSETLKPRLDGRVKTMLDEGLLLEVQAMHDFQSDRAYAGSLLDQSRGIWAAIGYKEFLPYFLAVKAGDVGTEDLERLKAEGIERTQIRTKQYANTQLRWIRGKLLPALRQRNLHGRFFVLDATDLPRWQNAVQSVADQVTEAFLQGETLPKPTDFAGSGIGVLRPGREQLPCPRHCDSCNKTMMLQEEWDAHERSKRHKFTARSKGMHLVSSDDVQSS